MDRKQFIKSSGRWILLSAMGIFSGYLVVNHKIGENEDCRLPGCSNCSKLKGCGLQQAEKFRQDG